MQETVVSNTVVLCANTSWYLFNFRRSTIQALSAAGYEVVCISPLDAFSDRLRQELGATHLSLPLAGKSQNPFSESRAFVFLWRAIKTLRPAFVFNFTIKLNLYSGLCCRFLDVPYANNVSGLGTAFLYDTFFYRQLRKIYGWVNRSGNHVFFQNRDDVRVFQDLGLLDISTYTVLPGSGVNLTRFPFIEMSFRSDRVFLMVSRLLGDKGVREFVEAAAILKARRVPVRFQLLGPLGADNRSAITSEELRRWIDDRIIEYLGEANDVSPFLARAHVLVLPSYREGMPRTVLEAASTGRPAIVADVPGSRDAIVPDETGWFCDARSGSSLADAMMHVLTLDDSTLACFGANARRNVEKNFSEEVVVDAYLNCLRAAVSMKQNREREAR